MRLLDPSIRTVLRPSAVTALLLLSSACATYRGRPVPASDAVPLAATKDEGGPTPGEPRQGLAQGSIARLLVRRATMLLEVKDPEAVARRVTDLTQSLGGYVEQSREASGGAVHLRIRVPAASLEATMDSVATLGHVEKRQISADDVTEQVVDLGARVATRRAVRDRLRALLERAQSIEDVITVERELARVQGELDVLERRLEYLRGTSSLAELSVDAREKRILGPLGLVVAGTGWVLQKLFIIR